MITLGVDPGTNITGYGLVTGGNLKQTCVDYGAIRATPKAPLADRLVQIYEGILKVIETARPSHLALEEAFFAKNAQNALKLGMVRGVIMLAARRAGLEVFEYSPLLIKQTVTGYGRAEKEQVRAMVKIHLALKELPASLDASDALAAAITHIVHHGSLVRRAEGAR